MPSLFPLVLALVWPSLFLPLPLGQGGGGMAIQVPSLALYASLVKRGYYILVETKSHAFGKGFFLLFPLALVENTNSDPTTWERRKVAGRLNADAWHGRTARRLNNAECKQKKWRRPRPRQLNKPHLPNASTTAILFALCGVRSKERNECHEANPANHRPARNGRNR